MTSPTPSEYTTSVVDRSFLDPRQPVPERVRNLLDQMTLEEKAGQLFHSMIRIGADGTISGANPEFGLPSTENMIVGEHITHFNVLGDASTPGVMAQWHNRVQELASSTRLGIPVTLSTDPRHSTSDNPGAAVRTHWFSQWPEPLGLAATRDEDLVERFADIARQEYLAVGLRVALHPQLDITTESRWSRQIGTFGEDSALAGRLGAAYIRGFQGPTLGPHSVSTMTKHFPGGGPQKDGEDPHFEYGKEQVYPGDQFEHHLGPFIKAIKAGASQIMPYYGVPTGLSYEEVGFAFNRSVITGILRERLGFEGIVCTDWGLLTDAEILGDHFPARAWGVENLTPMQRAVRAIEAGVDQFGGEHAPDLVVQAVREGHVSVERLDLSVGRVLTEKFRLGLFDTPMVDSAAADTIVGSLAFIDDGQRAQSASIVLLHVDRDRFPIPDGAAIYSEGVDRDVLARYGVVVDTPEQADFAIVRLHAPYEVRATSFENFFHAGSLEFPSEVVNHVIGLSRQLPTLLDVYLDRPAILTPFVDEVAVLSASFGVNSQALLDVIFARRKATGKLPFDIPRSAAAAAARRADVPFDTVDPLYRFGDGVS